jgi:hypothetical protein
VTVKMGSYSQVTVEGEIQVLGTESAGVLLARDFSGDRVFVSGAGPVAIDSLDVARCGGYGLGLASPSPSLAGLTASDTGFAGLWLRQTHGATLSGLSISGSGGPAIEDGVGVLYVRWSRPERARAQGASGSTSAADGW